MSGILGKKIGMTSIYDENGKNIPCTVIEAGPCVVTQVRTTEKDGYEAIQLAFEEKKDKHTTKALKGHFAKAGTTPKRLVSEFIGASSYPSRVFKGMRMAGRTGGNTVKVLNLQVMKIVQEKNLLVVKGSVPGPNNSYVKIERWS